MARGAIVATEEVNNGGGAYPPLSHIRSRLASRRVDPAAAVLAWRQIRQWWAGDAATREEGNPFLCRQRGIRKLPIKGMTRVKFRFEISVISPPTDKLVPRPKFSVLFFAFFCEFD